MTRKYLAFDIETATDVPGTDFNWKPHRPLGITCVAAFASDEAAPRTWSALDEGSTSTARMNRAQVNGFVSYLADMAAKGYTLLSWNGLQFDWDILAEESGAAVLCSELALQHVDCMFHVFCEKGFPVGLSRAAQALKIPGKTEGVSGEFAPVLWAAGKHQVVLEYVAQDTRVLLQVATLSEAKLKFEWITSKGKPSSMSLSRGWLPVQEALKLPEPDTSWMSTPLLRREFISWLTGK